MTYKSYRTFFYPLCHQCKRLHTLILQGNSKGVITLPELQLGDSETYLGQMARSTSGHCDVFPVGDRCLLRFPFFWATLFLSQLTLKFVHAGEEHSFWHALLGSLRKVSTRTDTWSFLTVEEHSIALQVTFANRLNSLSLQAPG